MPQGSRSIGTPPDRGRAGIAMNGAIAVPRQDPRVLIVKLSSLGDVVHAMPAVQDIRAAHPGAGIDWVVEPGFAPLVQRCAGVRRVIPFALRRWRSAPLSAQTRAQWRAFRAALASEAYDLVLDLQGLTKSALVAWLARLAPGGRRWALGLRTEGSGWERPTRWVADEAVTVPRRVHAVERGRLLVAAALGRPVPDSLTFGLDGLANRGSGATKTVLLVHGSSRADKDWPAAHWVALGRRLLAAGWHVALPQASDAEQRAALAIAAGIAEGMAAPAQPLDMPVAGGRPTCAAVGPVTVWPRMDLARLAECMAGCAGVIGVDSGLSHIAVALGLPHVQLYNHDTAWRTGPQGAAHQRSVFGHPVPAVEPVWACWVDCVAAARTLPRGLG